MDNGNVKVTATQQHLIDLGIVRLIDPCINGAGHVAPDCHLFEIDYDKLEHMCTNVTLPSEDWTYSNFKINGENTIFTVIVSLSNHGSYVY